MDPDALFATRILTTLLERDCLSYRLSPVSGWKELGRVIESLKWQQRGQRQEEEEDEEEGEDEGESETRILVLINVGAAVDLYGYLHLPSNVTCHLIDSHRPYALENLFASSDSDLDFRRGVPATGGKVVVWDDGDIAEDMQEEMEAYRALEFEPDSEEEESEEGEEDDSEAEDERAFRAAQKRQQRRMGSSSSLGSNSAEEEEDDEEEDDEDEDEDGEPRRKKRRRKTKRRDDGVVRLAPRDKQKYASRIKKYFASGTSHGQSVAGMMYVLAGSRGLADNDLLWCASFLPPFLLLSTVPQAGDPRSDVPIHRLPDRPQPLRRLRLFLLQRSPQNQHRRPPARPHPRGRLPPPAPRPRRRW